MRQLREEVRSDIASDQRERLEKAVKQDPRLEEKVGELLPKLENIDPITVEDIIASLQAGLGITDFNTETTESFHRFFPDFVEQLEKASEETNRGRIIEALQNGSRQGPIDFSGLGEDTRLALTRLLESWFQRFQCFWKKMRTFGIEFATYSKRSGSPP